MSNRPHPFEQIVLRVHDMRKPALRLFLRDGELCAEERAFLEMLDSTHEEATEVYSRKRAADYIERGGEVTRYGQQLFEPVGMSIVNLEEVRQVKKIVAFPTRDNDAG